MTSTTRRRQWAVPRGLPRWLVAAAVGAVAAQSMAPVPAVAGGLDGRLPRTSAGQTMPVPVRSTISPPARVPHPAPGHEAAGPPRAPRPGPDGREAAATVSSDYLDTCNDITDATDALDVRRFSITHTSTADPDRDLVIDLSMCPGHPALGGFGGRSISVQTRTTDGGALRLIEVRSPGPDQFEVRTFSIDPILHTQTPLSGPPQTHASVVEQGGWDRLRLEVPYDDLGIGSCDPSATAGCLTLNLGSFGSGQDEPSDLVPNADRMAPSWPSNCRPALQGAGTSPAASPITSRLRVRTTASSTAAVTAALTAAGYPVVRLPNGRGVEVLTAGTAELVAALQSLPGVTEVTRASPRRASATEVIPDDPRFSQQWALPRIGMPSAWASTTGSSEMVIAVVDDGISGLRPEFLDGAEPRTLAGYDAVDLVDGAPAASRLLAAGTDTDIGGHGTAVASVLAATGNDAQGMAGVDWHARLVPVRVFDHEGCFASDAGYLSALDWIAEQVEAGAIDVVNLSLGGEAIDGEADRIARIIAGGATVVAATGNFADVNGAAPSYPAALPDVVAVAAVGPDDVAATYANGGRYVDVTAPGGRRSGQVDSDILVVADPTLVGTDYGLLAGTSFSAPLVSGLAALYRRLYPASTPADLVRALLSTAGDLGDDAGFDIRHGFGIVDAPAALATAPGQLTMRLAGPNRYATAAAASRRAFPNPGLVDVVVLATGVDFPDALSAGPLAAREHAPLLLTPSAGLAADTRHELERLGPATVLLMGGTSALSPTVESELSQMGFAVDRIAGVDRYDTSRQVAVGRSVAPGSTWNHWSTSSIVYLATGTNFADALAGGAAAAAVGAPLLLTTPSSLHPATDDALRRLNPSTVVVLGGASAIRDDVVAQVRQLPSAPEVVRVAGRDRYETAALATCPTPVACVSDTRFGLIATGSGFADALGGAAAAAGLRAPLLLTPGSGPAPSLVIDALDGLDPEQLLVLGGTAAVSDPTVGSLAVAVVR